MDEARIQDALFRARRKPLVIAPNYTAPGWWEADLYAVSPKRLAIEYEIKRSLSDFNADAKKRRCRGWFVFRRCKSKAQALKRGDKRGPSFFYYAVTEDIAEAVWKRLPKYAGLRVIYFDGSVETWKKAPKLHGKRVSRDRLAKVRMKLARRYWRGRLKKR